MGETSVGLLLVWGLAFGALLFFFRMGLSTDNAANCSAPAGNASTNCGEMPLTKVRAVKAIVTPFACSRVRATSIGCKTVCATAAVSRSESKVDYRADMH